MKLKKVRGLSSGCEPRIEVIVKLKIKKSRGEGVRGLRGRVGSGVQLGWGQRFGGGFGRCEPRIGGIVKRA